jgi:hypothetical protein
VRIVNASYTILQDGIAGSGDELIVAAGSAALENCIFVATTARAARLLAESDPRRASQARRAAIEEYPFAIKAIADPHWKTDEGPNVAAPHEVLAYAALAGIALYDLTGSSEYSQDAIDFAKRMLTLQEQGIGNELGITGYFNRDPGGRRRAIEIHTSFADAPIAALAALCERFPDHPDRIAWYAGVAIQSECFFKRGAATTAPYHHVPTAIWQQADIEPYVRASVGTIRFAEKIGAPEIAPLTNEAGVRSDIGHELAAAMPLGPQQWLRTFPIALDRVFHGNATIQLARGIALVTAARLRRSGDLRRLAQLQLEWQVGLNPFGNSILYGVGERFASQMLLWTDDLVGAMPVGMDSRRDQPFWPHTSHMTSREMWIVPTARLMSLVSGVSAHARLLGVTKHNARCTNLLTRKSFVIGRGNYDLSLPAGRYRIELEDGRGRNIVLIGGVAYRDYVDVMAYPQAELEIVQESGKRTLSATVATWQPTNIRLQGHNLTITNPVRSVSAGSHNIRWNVETVDSSRAWVAILETEAGDLIADIVGTH